MNKWMIMILVGESIVAILTSSSSEEFGGKFVYVLATMVGFIIYDKSIKKKKEVKENGHQI